MTPDAALLERFRADLDGISAPGERIGLAVSGGPDSLALLLLAAAVRPGLVEAATVDHRFRPGAQAESLMVADLCARLNVPHQIIALEWEELPVTAIQQRAREARYDGLGAWVEDRSLDSLVTAHHADDQAETLIMRLNRGSGVRGLAGMRPKSLIPGCKLPLIRPLLGWRHAELEAVCAAGGLEPAADPSNDDDHYERVRVRQGLAAAPWLDPFALTRSAGHLAAADDALGWTAESLAGVRITRESDRLRIDTTGLPAELQRRLLLIAFEQFGAVEPRGSDLSRALEALRNGKTATLSGLKLEGGDHWQISKAAPRRIVSRAH